MKKIVILSFFAFSLVAFPALAEKPDWAGKGKPTVEQRDEHEAAMEAKESRSDNKKWRTEEAKKVKTEKEKEVREQGSNEAKGLEKQTAKKSEQVQKELDKGSEQGQEARQKRKKWWRFWE